MGIYSGSDDPMADIYGQSETLGGMAAYLPGQNFAFDRDVITGMIDTLVSQGASNIGGTLGLEGKIAAGQERLNKLLNKPVTEMTEEEKSIYTEVTGNTPDVQDLSATNLENNLLDKNLSSLGGNKSIVIDDPETEWEKVDKTKDLAAIFQDALDIFGAYDRNSIRKVVDVVNDRGVSAQEVATITGNTVESINQAAAESDTAINNQGTASDGTGDGTGDTGDVFNEATDTLNTGEVLTTGAPDAIDNTVPAVVTGGDEVTPDDTPVAPDDTPVAPDDTPVTTNDTPVTTNDTPVTSNDTPVTSNDTPVIPVLDTTIIAEDPNVIVDDTPILPTIMQPTPKQTTNISLFQSIQDTPITDSHFFEPKFTELDNIPVGMFERFLQATGGR